MHAKIRLAQILLLVAALWPAVQLTLVKTAQVNPWKLAGWGMYSAPQIPAYVEVFGLTPDEVGEYEVSRVPAGAVPELERFLRLRRGLGDLVAPERLAKGLLDRWIAVDGVRIVVVQPRIDPGTGLIVERRRAYVYRR